MAAVVAGSTHAPLTAILILFELTRDEYVLLPIMLAAVIATVVSQLIKRDSVYTFKLRREGVLVGAARDLTILRRLRVSDVEPEPMPAEPIYASDPVSKLIALHATTTCPTSPSSTRAATSAWSPGATCAPP
jgi:CIC family chloride channel protein